MTATRTQFGVLLVAAAGAVIAACAGSTPSVQPSGGAAAPVTTANSPATAPSAAQSASAMADSILRDAPARFMREFQAQSKPMLEAGNYLGIVQLLDRLKGQAGSNRDVESIARQYIGTYATLVGQPQEALEAFAFGRPDSVRFDAEALGRMTSEDAVDAVARLAADRQAVFINEAHHIPRHRVFTANLLPRLRALGFTHLAVETLDESDTALNTRGYPVRESGFYSNEPAFGEMLRTASRLGFKLVPYESPSKTQDEREQGQARHIVERILRADPKARIVVHAGYEHINESGTLSGARPMAVRFREMTGIDPLTVDQTVLTEQADTTFEDTRYLFLMKRVRRQNPYVLRSGDSVWSARPGVHDVTVISPRAVHRAGRPNWFWTFGSRRAYLISDEACAKSLDCVVTARRVGESEDAVPVDVLRIQFSAPGSKTFALPPGQYVIEARDGSGIPLSRQTITIPGR